MQNTARYVSFAALYWVALQLQASKDALHRGLAKVTEVYIRNRQSHLSNNVRIDVWAQESTISHILEELNSGGVHFEILGPSVLKCPSPRLRVWADYSLLCSQTCCGTACYSCESSELYLSCTKY